MAFTSSLMFAISYSSAGSLEPLVVGGDYIGIIFLSAFLSIYFCMVKKGSDSKIMYYLLGLIFLILSLSIATTRTFPVIMVILVTEIFILLIVRSRYYFKPTLKRIGFFLLPIILIGISNPALLTRRLSDIYPWIDRYYFKEGMYELLLVPFLSFASTILPVKSWSTSITTNVILFLMTIIIGWILSKKPWRFISVTLLIWAIGFIIINWFWSISATNHFPDLKNGSPVAFYFLGFSLASFIEWSQTKNKLYIGLFLGPIFSFIFIFNIWLGTQEKLLVFTNIHRYLTHSSIFISFFAGSLIVVLYKKFSYSKLLKFISFSPFLIIPFYLIISASEINKFYQDRFEYGFTLKDQDYMRKQLVPYLQDIKIPSLLIYIDISTDKGISPNTILQNSYYYSNKYYYSISYYYGQIYRYGPLYWMFWYNKNTNDDTVPHSIFDFDLLKSSVTVKNGVKGILYQGKFYTTEDFRAVRVMNREVVDIRDQIVKDLGLSQ